MRFWEVTTISWMALFMGRFNASLLRLFFRLSQAASPSKKQQSQVRISFTSSCLAVRIVYALYTIAANGTFVLGKERCIDSQ